MNLTDVATFLAVLARVAAWMSTAPYIGEKSVPAKARMAASILVAALLTPSRVPVATDELMMILPAELLLGVVAGFATRLPLSAAETAGQLVGLQLELGFAGTMDPMMKEESLPTRRIAYSLAGLAFLGAGGLEMSLRALTAAPITGLTHHGFTLVLSRFIVAAGDVLPVALLGVAPILVAAVVVNLAVGLISRAAPGFNILALMVVAVLTVGGGVLWLTAPSFVQTISSASMRGAGTVADLLAR